MRREEQKDYIDEHISEDFTVVGLSKTFYRSKKYFRKCFKMRYGMEPRAYIVKKKAEIRCKGGVVKCDTAFF